jgi:hypothetical protein
MKSYDEGMGVAGQGVENRREQNNNLTFKDKSFSPGYIL